MLIKAAYPALVTAKPPGRPFATRCVVRREVELNIPEVSAADAPLVMTVSGSHLKEAVDWGGPVPVRLIGGRYYRPTMPIVSFAQALADPLASPTDMADHPRERVALYGGARKRVYQALTHYTGPVMRPWPPCIQHLLRTPTGRDSFFPPAREFAKTSAKLKLDEDAIAEADTYRDHFLKDLEGMVIIDGCVWRETLEPVYCVSISSPAAVVFPERLAPPHAPLDAMSFNVGSHFFSADRREDAIDFARRYSDNPEETVSVLSMTGENIEVHDTSGLSGNDMIALGLFAAARCMLDLLDRPLVALTIEARAALGILRAAILASDPQNEISPDLESAVVGILDIGRNEIGFIGDHFPRDFPEHIQLHLARQDERSYSLRIVGGAPRV